MTAQVSPMRIAGIAVAVLAALGLRWSTVHLWNTGLSDQARVRQSWSARPERVERCRRLTDEELEKLPAHMRLRTECQGGFARYLLTMSVDGTVRTIDTLRPGGLQHDRPIHVFRELDIDAGARHVRLEVVRLDSTTNVEPTQGSEPSREGAQGGADTLMGGREAREADERARRASEALPPRLTFDTTVTLAPRHVVLIAFDDVRRRFVAQTEH